MNFAKLLSLAFVMIAGPQILIAIFLATTENWRRNSAAFLAGAAVSMTAVGTLAYLLGSHASNHGSSNKTIDVVILVVLAAAAVHTFITRKQSKPPKWMGQLEGTQPKGAFRLGFLLLGVFPTDILTSIAVGGYASSHGEPWWHVLAFVVLTLVILALPALMLIAFGRRAEADLPKVRDWMNANSWLVSEFVLVLFMGLTISSIAS